jgi:sigma-54 specific flagellar transcriptional regulator A
MAEHGWPGNVRELRNFVDRANVMFAGRTIGADEAGALLVRRGRVGAIESRALWAATDAEIVEAPAEIPADQVVVPLRARAPSVPPSQMQAGEPVALKEMLAEIERRYIEQALTVSGGVIADAARMLSLQRTTLIEKMRKYEMKAA